MPKHEAIPDSVLANWGLAGARVEPIQTGWINRTWRVATGNGEQYALQRVNPMFPTAVHADIDAITARLEAQGVATPRLVPDTKGELFVQVEEATWRLFTYVEGDTRLIVADTPAAQEAGRLLARFHAALENFEYAFQSKREGVHDTPRHLRRLREALADRKEHPRFASIAPLANEILEAAAQLPKLPPLPRRKVHGDPKISNVLFARGSHKALCLVDLDTLSEMPLPLELGDALRSWCNVAGEDTRAGEFSVAIFEAAIEGYAENAMQSISPGEVKAILPATLTIGIELAARFCADALFEDFFGWTPKRFGSHSEHSEVRAAGQLAAAQSLRRQSTALARILAGAFGSLDAD
ncbi:MAG: phosphotransferase [Gammaproteobacteria bacterium]|nr:phosphotransferase [Gammaproteobacteria bacterium]